MTVVVDSTIVVALYDEGDDNHQSAREWITLLDEDLVTTPLALAEMDYVVTTHGGPHARDVLWRDLETGAYTVRWWADGLFETLRIARRYPFAGLVDASLVALASLLRTDRVATFDEHFRSLTLPGGEPVTMLPADA